MRYVKGFTFLMWGMGGRAGEDPDALLSEMKKMKEALHTDTVMLAFEALMDTPHVEEIDWHSPATPSDETLSAVILGAEKMGLRVFLKPMVNCRNHEWRAYINFITPDVPCEPKWSGWFRNYTEYMCHYAALAEETGCEMLLVGCELVMAQPQDALWRKLIADVRASYHGLISFNCDKYQEGNVTWWDACDVISSSGYYPTGTWQENLDRIEAVVQKFDRPFFFAECGCPGRKDAEKRPNDWTNAQAADQGVQTAYYRDMFAQGKDREWLLGYAGWAWGMHDSERDSTGDYSVSGTETADVIRNFYDAVR